jgi:hypothetical protein
LPIALPNRAKDLAPKANRGVKHRITMPAEGDGRMQRLMTAGDCANTKEQAKKHAPIQLR